MFFLLYFLDSIKIIFFFKSNFQKAGGLLIFYFFVKHEKSICEHDGNNTEFVIYCYAVEEFGRNCS